MKKGFLYGSTMLALFPALTQAQQGHEIIPPSNFVAQEQKQVESPVVVHKIENKKIESPITNNTSVSKPVVVSPSSVKEKVSSKATIVSNNTAKTPPSVETSPVSNQGEELTIVEEQNISMKDIKEVKRDPVLSTPRMPFFSAKRSEMLSSVLSRWAEQEGWTLHWSYPQDFRLPADIQTSGSVEETFEKISRSLITEGIDLNITLYRSNKVILVR